MGWIQKLYETYENCQDKIGVLVNENEIPLLPIAHSTQNAQIEVVIDGKGNYRRASIIQKGNDVTIIPVTEDSATRSSGVAPHPLCDKLQYIAGDYCDYVRGGDNKYFTAYMDYLDKWCSSIYKHPKVSLIHEYIKKAQLMEDLINDQILLIDEHGMLKDKVKVVGTIEQADAFVRFRVEIPEDNEARVWMDKSIYDSHIQFYLSNQEKSNLCYIRGINIPCSEKHPAKIRNTGDKAKLISANDTSGFTFRGRFSEQSQVVSIGYETSQKAHSALRWLVNKQGFHSGDQVILAFGTNDQKLPSLKNDTEDALFDDDNDVPFSTEEEYAHRVNQAIAGYRYNFDDRSEVILMAFDAATIGRLSITHYREYVGSEFLDKVKYWHETCCWRHHYRKKEEGTDDKGKPIMKYYSFIGAPSPKDIAKATYGSRLNDKLEKATILRLLSCITDGAALPYDIVNSAVNQVSNPVSMERWEWNKNLTITCALIKKYRKDRKSEKKEEWTMALDENETSRSYLYGRLLAIADEIERRALFEAKENRDTNAERMMHQFRLQPYKTWGLLHDKLRPYQSRLGKKAYKLNEMLTQISSRIPIEEFTKREKLEDVYLLGFYCQKQAFTDERIKISEAKKKTEDQINNEGEIVHE